MRREIVREEQEMRPQREGGKTWRDIANEVDAEKEAKIKALEARIAELEEERHADVVAMRTMSLDFVRKCDELLKRDRQVYQLQHQLRLEHRDQEGVDVQAEVEPEEESAQA